ncbi:unnamed protein product, partial [Rotaria socialis]
MVKRVKCPPELTFGPPEGVGEGCPEG